jgi:hypothetical protein
MTEPPSLTSNDLGTPNYILLSPSRCQLALPPGSADATRMQRELNAWL